MNALQEQFVTEARELIRQATEDLIALERDGHVSRADRPRVSRLSYTQGFGRRGRTTRHEHRDACRRRSVGGCKRGALGASADTIDQALACLDLVSRWVDEFETAAR